MSRIGKENQQVIRQEILHYSQVYLHYLMVVDHMFTFSTVKKFSLKFPEFFFNCHGN